MKKLFATMMIVVASLSATMAMAGNVVTETYPIKSNYTAISATNMIEVVLLDTPKKLDSCRDRRAFNALFANCG